MKTVIEMAREAGLDEWWNSGSEWRETFDAHLERFAELARADERNSWPAEMEAMERQVNILTDALAESRREIYALVALARADECGRMCEQLKECSSEKSTSNETNRSAILGEGG